MAFTVFFQPAFAFAETNVQLETNQTQFDDGAELATTSGNVEAELIQKVYRSSGYGFRCFCMNGNVYTGYYFDRDRSYTGKSCAEVANYATVEGIAHCQFGLLK